MKIPPSIWRYWLAMNATAMQSAVHAVQIYCGIAGASVAANTVTQANISPLTLQQGALVFLIAFGKAILNYLDANPLPVLGGTVTAKAVDK